MKKNITNKTRFGFTLIEVVIVLAIGALIILVVLNAVNSARRNQRDSTRRTEASQIAAALESYAANNDQQYPNDLTALSSYESELITKYNTGAAAGDCATTEAGDYDIVYNRLTPYSYELSVCLENEANPVSIQD